MNLLLLLAGHFILLSLMAIGGASATMPEMHRVLVDSLHLMNSTQFSQMYAISQAAPGPNVLFVALFGFHIAGFGGAITCLVSMCGPAGLLAVFVEHFGAHYKNDKYFIIIKRALAPIAIGLLCSTGFILLKNANHWTSYLLTATTVILLRQYRSLNPIWLILAGAVLGMGGFI